MSESLVESNINVGKYILNEKITTVIGMYIDVH